MDTSNHRITPAALEHLRDWVGREETVDDDLSAAPVRGMAAMLDLAKVPGARGEALRPLWHWLYFLPRAPQAELGDDGHPRLGGFLPPVPLPRRMWAGGRLEWLAPLHVGDVVRRSSRIASVAHKAGRSGDLVFVTVRHEVSRDGEVALTEEQDIVYRAAAQPGDPVPVAQPAPTDAVWSCDIRPDPVLLFRYSALTFNGHRIHYDRDYATGVEGYPGLVVHGPLIATLLCELAVQQRPDARLRRFAFKAVRPTFDTSPLRVCGKPSADGQSAQLWAQDHEGALTMQADVQFA
ncbi:FAS1-like dehydratase domain-containing protein [Hydrogenophaga sp. BPS33]|uniref:FAS1-like dehydratase domain-containing protein n=1 Tax=Hydrogenophaga sp. BPS33 TaxID=2651974 RepID=UPI00131FCB04|nr:MaoC family dehydratase N-terminal domain-containing protein [Hydrogenophaga sp. BPS33]QHE87854.1 acyl-CoA dehydrogenase [Hydrogenophaga sp. BPS33]